MYKKLMMVIICVISLFTVTQFNAKDNEQSTLIRCLDNFNNPIEDVVLEYNSQQYITDNNGETHIPLKNDNLKIRKISVPDGYEMLEDIIEIDNTDVNEIVTVDKNLTAQTTHKTDKDNSGSTYETPTEVNLTINSNLPNVKIGVFKDGVAITEVTIGESMSEVVTLEPATYSIHEIETPKGYNTLVPKEVSLNADTSIDLNFEPIRGKIKVTVIDINSQEGIKDVKLSIVKDDKEVTELTTDDNGIAITDTLDYGKYTIKEKEVPQGYTLTETEYDIEVVEQDKEHTVDIKKSKVEDVVVTIKDKGGNPVPNVSLVLTMQVKSNKNNNSDAVDVFKTDDKGQVTFKQLPKGSYTLEITEVPAGYKLPESTFTLDTNDSQTLDISLDKEQPTEQPKGSIKILMQDAETGNAINGTVKINNGDTHGTVNGVVVLQDLEEGNYTVTQVTVESGYILSSEPITVEVKPNKEIEIIIKNHKSNNKGAITINKIDSLDGTPLAGVEFEIFNRETNKSVAKIKSNETGKAQAILDFGDYYITETATLDTHMLDNRKYDFSITQNKINVFADFANMPWHSRFEITLKSKETNEPIPNATFIVTSQDTGEEVTLTTDKNGFTFMNLDLGVYSVEQKSTADGYNLTKPYNIEVIDPGLLYKQAVYNSKEGESPTPEDPEVSRPGESNESDDLTINNGVTTNPDTNKPGEKPDNNNNTNTTTPPTIDNTNDNKYQIPNSNGQGNISKPGNTYLPKTGAVLTSLIVPISTFGVVTYIRKKRNK